MANNSTHTSIDGLTELRLNLLCPGTCHHWEQPLDHRHVWWLVPRGRPSSLEAAPPAAWSVWCNPLGTAPADVLSHPPESAAVHNMKHDFVYNKNSLFMSLVPLKRPKHTIIFQISLIKHLVYPPFPNINLSSITVTWENVKVITVNWHEN